ncbi:MAG: hypothetical protein JNM57_12285 [Cyclobacteriaceae bacterium]|nr:hypothetical protein [Cyclobacteriaceae bacterium]
MVGDLASGILIIIITAFLAHTIVNRLRRKYTLVDTRFLKQLFYYHVLLSIVYYLYVLFNPSDSKAYYNSVVQSVDWFSLYGTSTTFIRFLAYPFVQYLSLSYEGAMALFAFFGYLGFVFLYIVFKELIRFPHKFMNADLIKVIFLLPNLHFWSGSLGKGSVIFLGIGLYFFGILNLGRRWLYVVIGALIIYHVRPHIMLIILLSSVLGFVFTTRNVNMATRLLFLAAAGAAFFFIYRDVLTLVGIDEEEFLTQGLDLTHRASELGKATSGVDITSYSLPLQLFTFLFRPLFVDAPGALGLVVSVENVFYLLLTLKLFNWRGVNFLIRGNFMVKSAFLSFLTVSIALAQISGNLGLAIRQKSQVMILFMLVIMLFLDEQKLLAWRRQERFKKSQQPKTEEA